MEAGFYITFTFGPEHDAFGRFELGGDRGFAYALFEELEGDADTRETDSLTMELMETSKGLPLNLKIKRCSLDQLAANCRHLTKELFRKKNLGI